MSKHHKTVIAKNEAISQLCQSRSGKPTTPTVIARNEAISKLSQSRTGNSFSKRLPQAITLLFCLTLSLNSFAQKRSGATADSSKNFIIKDAKPIGNAKPLIIVNGKIYKKGMRSIDTSQIKEITVLNGEQARVLYGSNAANGVIIITTKK